MRKILTQKIFHTANLRYTQIRRIVERHGFNMKDSSKYERIDTIRMKDIVAQLTDIIYLLCDAKETDSRIIISQLTNLTPEEKECLHITFSGDPAS